MKRSTKIPTRKKRRNRVRNWRPAFLRELAAWGNVARACQRAKIDRRTAYTAYNAETEFKARWDEALEVACDALEQEARRRAVKGCDEGVFYQGHKVAKLIKYSDTLLIFLLKAHRPAKYRETIRNENWNLTDEQFSAMSDEQLQALARGVSVPEVLAMVVPRAE